MKSTILIIIICSLSSWLYAQQQIKGNVFSQSDNVPIVGAIISLQRSDITVATDINGHFEVSINTGKKVTISVSHIGYEVTLIALDLPQKDTLNIFLNPITNVVDRVEIVSTGYQRIPKERATGSFSTVSNELFNQQVGTDILSRLPHIANSMVMDNSRGGAPQMMVRGLSTIRGPKDPLIIVDNFPYDGDLTNINPNIVESITILKDASASSIWGARAANGVIVITTKSGQFNRPITLEFNSNITVGSKPDLGYIRQMSSSDYIDMEQELFSRNFYNSQINSLSRPVISPVVNLLNQVRNGELSEVHAMQQIDEWRAVDAREHFNQYMYSQTVNQQYFLSAQGGAEKFSWTSAIGYDYNKDYLGATYERINLRFQNTSRPVKQLSLTTGLLYTQNQNQSGRYGYNDVSVGKGNFVPYMQMADAEGNPLPVAKNFSPNYIRTAGDGLLLDWNYYPLIDWKHNTSNNRVSDILVTAGLDYLIIKGLNATINYQYERQLGMGTTLADENSFDTRDYINRFTQIIDGTPDYIVPLGGILNKNNHVLSANNLRGQLSFDNTYDRHNVTAIAGMEIRSINSDSHSERFYGYNSNNLTIGAVDYTKTYPTLPRGTSFIERGQDLRETATRFVSQFANVAYTFDNRYVVSSSFRRDASNLFGLNTNDQWNPFWSAGIAWKLSNEKFYSIDFLPYVNLRATYGFSGNIDPAMVAVNTISYHTQLSFINDRPMAYFSNYYNPNLKWETSKMVNIAVDFRAKNDRFSGSLEYYRKNGENLFGTAPIDLTTGIQPNTLRNVARMKGNGWDLELRSLNIDRGFKWRTILNFSVYRDKIVDYNIDRTLAREYVNLSSPPISGIEGHSVYSIYAYKWAGLEQNTGEALGFLEGEISKDYTNITGVGTKVEDLDYFGSAIPTKFGSMINSVSYKNLNLQIGISFKMGYSFRRNSINYTNLFSNWIGHSDYALRWQYPGDESQTNVPVNMYTTNSNRDAFYNGSSVLVEKGDHIRLQYINLGYDINMPSKVKSGIKGLSIYFNASNLGILWKANRADLDPDFSRSTSNIVNPANYTIIIRTKF